MRKLLSLCVTMLAAGALASVAGATTGKPTVVPYSFSGTTTLQGVCGFAVTVDAIVNGTETFFVNSDGSLRLAVHQTEADTFSANGITLKGDPYNTNIQAAIDSSGNLVSEENSGVAEKIELPDGTIFVTAGRTNALVWPPNNPNTFYIQPQFGGQGDLAAFCAALS